MPTSRLLRDSALRLFIAILAYAVARPVLAAQVHGVGPTAPSRDERGNVGLPPTFADVRYGPHARNVLDFWLTPKADSSHAAPIIVYIHGGGFLSGDKSGIRRDPFVRECLDAGVSFAAINYRYLDKAAPLQDVLRDCARAIQFLRGHAGEWHIDSARVAVYGSSAGAGASLWLAAHADLVDAQASDPVLRQSSRVACAGLNSPQFSYDWLRWTDVFGADAVARFGGRYNSPELYGFTTPEELRGSKGAAIRADCDLLGLLDRHTPPLYINTPLPSLALENSSQFLHHPRHAKLLYDRCRELGLSVVASIPALGIAPPPDGPRTWRDFVFGQLGVGAPSPRR